MKSLQVALGSRSYPIHVGRELPPALYSQTLGGRSALCVVDAEVARLQAARLDRVLPGLPREEIPSGEGSKRLAQLERLALSCLSRGLGRDALIVAVGGGVTGDLAGFLAASYMRGVDFVQVPTTLLALVDASVGGKVAVNLPGAKNSLGAFHQPRAVLADLAWLDTLPARELGAGIAELVKMAALMDAALLDRLEALGPRLLDAALADWEELVVRACELKRAVVEKDEREAGLREILNFGHTLAHAIEGAALVDAPLHGEAVAVGMLLALRLGEGSGHSDPALRARLEPLIARLGLPTRLPPAADPRRLLELMAADKKRRNERLRFVLLADWGRPLRGIELDDAIVAETLAELAP